MANRGYDMVVDVDAEVKFDFNTHTFVRTWCLKLL